MTLKQFQEVKDDLYNLFYNAFLKCEEKKPGFMKEWFKAWAEGPPAGKA